MAKSRRTESVEFETLPKRDACSKSSQARASVESRRRRNEKAAPFIALVRTQDRAIAFASLYCLQHSHLCIACSILIVFGRCRGGITCSQHHKGCLRSRMQTHVRESAQGVAEPKASVPDMGVLLCRARPRSPPRNVRGPSGITISPNPAPKYATLDP